ncbi:MAG: TRAP transporter large permease [Burkholderiaceae bacterium]|nr:TRAP transporter large permease [Burkholderiaceae bacterium]
MTEVLFGFAGLFALMLLRVPIAYSMLVVGFFGIGAHIGWQAALSSVGQTVFDTGFSYTLSVLPLFVLMGNFLTVGGLSADLYRAGNALLGHFRGGLAMATVVASASFSAVCGSSVATTATMAKVAMPSMRHYGYSDELAAGSIAVGGTLGILIPPSVVLVIYGIMTQTNIGKLFVAGVVPGLLSVLVYLIVISLIALLRPAWGPRGARASAGERLEALRSVWSVAALFIVVIGGIYGGVFTATEAAGIGAAGAFLIALLRRTLTWRSLYEVLGSSARTTGILFSVLFGALVFSNFISLSGMPSEIGAWVKQMDAPAWVVIAVILIIYLVLGCVLETMSMILLTVPVFYPIVAGLGFDLVWFGIVVVIVAEISLITPPVGLNAFVLSGVVKDLPARVVFRGTLPFLVGSFVILASVAAVPGITLLLPSLMR